MNLLDTLRAFAHAERLDAESIGNEINEIHEESHQAIEKGSFSVDRRARGNYEVSPEPPPRGSTEGLFSYGQAIADLDESRAITTGYLIDSLNSSISLPNNSAAVSAEGLGSVDESETRLCDATKATELRRGGRKDDATASFVPGVLRGELDPAAWRDLYEERSAIRQYDGHYSRAEAEALAWSEAQTRWHMQCGERVSRDLCAGCRRPIGTGKALDLIDGNRVHTSDDNACLVRHGERWRAAATRALVVFGLRPPRAP